ncbi:MAG TPA: hypothetical protein VG225_17210 [Terracidiphilus sp.]|jgi:hypothetical protein|nr:hypothetical protein [Terracidiphilus sp.]
MRSFRRFAIISFSVVAFIASCSIIVSISSRPPKEGKIVRDFSAHRASYERVRTMLSEDKGVTGVATWGVQWEDSVTWKIPPDGGMPVTRYQEYLALLKEIGASRVDQGRDLVEVSFGTWGSGWGGDTRHVEISWPQREPPNTVITLDAFYRTDKPRSPSYVHIDGNWYIWADW